MTHKQSNWRFPLKEFLSSCPTGSFPTYRTRKSKIEAQPSTAGRPDLLLGAGGGCGAAVAQWPRRRRALPGLLRGDVGPKLMGSPVRGPGGRGG